MKRRILSLVLAILALASVAALCSGCSSTDYIATVKAMQPFKDDGSTTSYGTVINKYIASAKWSEKEESKSLAYVTVTGKLTASGVQTDVTVVFTVEPIEKSDMALIGVNNANVAGVELGLSGAEELMLAMFMAYEEGFSDLDEFFDYYG